MSHTSISPESMSEHNDKIYEKNHMGKINSIVDSIYIDAVNFANSGDETVYIYDLPQNDIPIDFYRKNIAEIINGIKKLFPDCSVEYKNLMMVRGRDGELYNISKANENIIPGVTKPIPSIIRPATTIEYIVLDWS
jgi:hypothetical protein